MSHPLHVYVASQLEVLLRERRVVVFYDPYREFEAFVDELEDADPPHEPLPRVKVSDTPAYLARYDGSFFALKAAAEPIIAQDAPEPLLLYLPGQQRDRRGSVLMEFEKAGAIFGLAPSHRLRSLARRQLRTRYTDGDIDELLAPESLAYGDIVRFLAQRKGEEASLLRLVLGEGSSEALIARWLSSEAHDTELEAKQATAELFKLVGARLGFTLSAQTPLAKARHQTLRYVLVGEFRDDLTCDPPDGLRIVPEPANKEEHQRIRDIASLLRSQHADRYSQMADGVEDELNLAGLALDAASLGRIDTFRFEERLLLDHAARLVVNQRYDEALAVAVERGRSFWVDRDLGRLAQWEALRLMAELGQRIARTQPSIKKAGGQAKQWVEAYAARDGWFEADRAQRALESWLAKMDDDPAEPLEKALGLVRRAHDNLLKEMAKGFTSALVDGAWAVPGVLHQTKIFPDVVEIAGGPVAYFFVDAMRYEMGAELADLLCDGEDLKLTPAVTALPSITPIGMAALLPGASSSFSVVEHKGKLASRIDDATMANLPDRMKYLKARRPEARDIDLGELLQKTTKALSKKLEGVPLVVVRSQSIDGLGEMDGGLLARQIMDTIVSNVARAVRKLARMGFEYFVVTSDHGHQFSIRKEEDMLMDRPAGETVDQHRRCWAGHGGQTPAACVRVSGAELGYSTDLDFIFPKGLAVFRAGGDLAFHHGGISLQEMVVPVLSLRIPSGKREEPTSKLVLEGYPKVLTNRTFGMRVRLEEWLFQEAVTARLVLLAEGQEVGHAGMALDAEFDRATGRVTIQPGQTANVAMMLTRDEFKKVRIVAQDPATDAVLAQSEEIAVRLGI